jgi:hypothetical protein
MSMNQIKQGRARSFAEEGTLYWLIVSATLLVYLAANIPASTDISFFVAPLALAIVEAVLGYAVWSLKKWSFLASILSAIVIMVLLVGILYSPLDISFSDLAFGFIFDPFGGVLLLLQLQVVLFAYRAHREPR